MQHTLYSNIKCFDKKIDYKRIFILRKNILKYRGDNLRHNIDLVNT